MAVRIRRGLEGRVAWFQPRGLAGTLWEFPATYLTVAVLVAIFVVEAATPNDVLAVFALLPLMGAMWLLSTAPAMLVGLIAWVLFLLAVALEANNRLTEICLGATALTIVVATRWYGSRLAILISAPRRQRHPGQVSQDWRSPSAGECLAAIEFLTRRELEVARLASGGHTAREIADLLHISERTVENHLANAYGKLGINSRPALIKMGAQLAGR